MDHIYEGLTMVGVRRKWPKEALDFTPWLAENLDLLGEVLGMKLTFCQREKPVGPLYLDILAQRVGDGVKVAIENQLEWTDVGHLGQLITYATGCDARIAIWVAPEFGYEFAEALNRLNEWTRDGIEFYGVKVEVYERAGDPRLKPRFRKVVYPGGWDETQTEPRGARMPGRKRQYYDFFEPLIDELAEEESLQRPTIRFNYTGRLFRSCKNPFIGFAVYLEGEGNAWVTLHIESDDENKTKKIYDKLCESREKIELNVDAGTDTVWRWHRHNGRDFSSVNIRRDGSIDDSPEELEMTRAWMYEHLIKFRDFFDSRLVELLT